MIKKHVAWLTTVGLAILLFALAVGSVGAGNLPPAEISAGAPGNPLDIVASSPLSGSTKTVNTTTAGWGDILTYTIVLSNSSNLAVTARLTDVMPAEISGGFLIFPTDISGTVIFPPGNGTVTFPGSAILPTGNWGWTGVISPNSRIILQMRVSLKTGYSEMLTITNRIDVSDGLGNTITRYSPAVHYDPLFYLYLPVIMKNYPPPPVNPPAGYCTPYVLGDVRVGNDPRGIAVNQSANRVYVANAASNTISVINDSNNVVLQTIGPAGFNTPTGIALDPDSNTIWVTNAGHNDVTPVYATAPYTVGTPIEVGGGPWGIAYNPVDRHIYVANTDSNTVSVINTISRTVINTIDVGSRPYNLAAHPLTGVVYVANFGSSDVSVLNAAGTLQLPINIDPYDEPYDVLIDPVHNYVYVTTVKTNAIVVINATKNTFIGATQFYRSDNPPTAVPLRAIGLNLNVATGDGGHIWTTTSATDHVGPGSNPTQILLIPKGYDSGFNKAIPNDFNTDHTGQGLQHAGLAVNPSTNRVYVSLPSVTPDGHGAVRVIADGDNPCFTTIRTLADILPMK